MSVPRALILAAGRGSRMGPLTGRRPKALLEVAGRAVFDRQIEILRKAGVREIWAVVGYRGRLLARPGVRAIRNPRWKTTNMVASFFAARRLFRAPLLVVYGDILFSPNHVRTATAGPGAVRVVSDRDWLRYFSLRTRRPYRMGESFRADGAGRILDLGRPDPSPRDAKGQYIGLLYFTRRGLAAAERIYDAAGGAKGRYRKAFFTDFLRDLVAQGVDLRAAWVRGGWLEFDAPRDVRLGARLLARGRLR